ncbi:tyrosine-type recombinase/integrase, partial [Thiomicrorhabdus sp. 6S2-11]
LNFDFFMQNLLRVDYEKILLLTAFIFRGDYHSALPDDSKLIWKTLYYTGLRPKELFNLKPEDIQKVEAKSKYVTCLSIAPKGDGKTKNATRLIPVHSELINDLKDFKGFSISQGTFEKRRRKAVIESYGEDFANNHDTYSLRHTFTTTLVSELGNADLVKWLVGHSRSGDVTFHSYFHGYGLEKLEQAVESVPIIRV